MEKSYYLCSVRLGGLTTPLSAGSKALSILLHLKSHLRVAFFIFVFFFRFH